MRAARSMTVDEMRKELALLEERFNASRASDEEGHGGSPGEWMVERMDELETELAKR